MAKYEYYHPGKPGPYATTYCPTDGQAIDYGRSLCIEDLDNGGPGRLNVFRFSLDDNRLHRVATVTPDQIIAR